MPSNVKLLAGASGGEPTDANFKNVTLLLHGDGSNGAQNNTFIDSSTNNFTITRNGNTTQGSFSPYGSNWSNYFDGSGDYLSIPSNAALAFGTGDFTIEFWVYLNTVSGVQILYDNRPSNGAYNTIYMNGSTLTYYVNTADRITSSALSANTWYHIAVSRSGTSTKMFVNGTQVGSTYSDSTNYLQATTRIGAGDTLGDNPNGYISNLRVLKGTALYTSNFTPSTTPLTAITNTSLLTCADNRFRDGSTNNFTITRNGDVKVTNFAPFAPSSAYSTTTNGGSAYFDGSGDYLQTPSSANLGLGTGDFTIEFWHYANSSQGSRTIFVGNSLGFTTNAWNIQLNNASPSITNKLQLWAYNLNSGAVVIQGNTTLVPNTWYHVALVRSGNTFTFYLNGVSDGTATNAASLDGGGANTISIARDGTDYFAGYMSNVRIVKGTAVYTAAFTPPSSPVTAITNTSLLLNATNAAIFDNSMKNDLETVGNAQISTSVKKFGTGSMYFDGTGDQLSIPSSDVLSLGTGNFTIELWMYHGTGAYVNSQPVLVQNWSTTWAANYWSFHADHNSGTAGKFTLWVHNFNSGSSPMLTSTSTSKTSTWNHVAIVRNGNSFAMYVNGVSEATATFSGSMDGGGTWPIYIGGPNQAYDGYIDDLRITKGVARYTANFTAPTAPFPNK